VACLRTSGRCGTHVTLVRWKTGDVGWAAPYGWGVNPVPLVEDAIALAARAHRGQRYASPEQEALSHRAEESYDEYIERVATNEIACRVKLADLRENLANNLRLPPSPGNAERLARYKKAVTRLASPS
jgi:hypothetical protein